MKLPIRKFCVWFAVLVVLVLSISPMVMLFSSKAQAEELDQDTHLESTMQDWIVNKNKAVTYKQAKQITEAIVKQANQQNVDPVLILMVMKVESSFNPKARSKYGAKGLMQVVPRWHKDKLKGRNPYDISTSVEVGTKVMADCLDKHRDKLKKAVSCYSGGASSKYYKSLVAFHKEYKRFNTLHAFALERQPRELRKLDDARIFKANAVQLASL